MRDINIAIAYHNTGRSMKDIGKEYGMSSANLRRIHYCLVRHMARCMGLSDVYFHCENKNHCEQMSVYLQEYRYLLQVNELKTEIILNDKDGQEALVISSLDENGFVYIKLMQEYIACEISIDDIKAALRKLSAK